MNDDKYLFFNWDRNFWNNANFSEKREKRIMKNKRNHDFKWKDNKYWKKKNVIYKIIKKLKYSQNFEFYNTQFYIFIIDLLSEKYLFLISFKNLLTFL